MVLMVQQVAPDLQGRKGLQEAQALQEPQDRKVHLAGPHSNTISAQPQVRLTQQQEGLGLIIPLKMPLQAFTLMIAT
jgi:hypothetical protein